MRDELNRVIVILNTDAKFMLISWLVINSTKNYIYRSCYKIVLSNSNRFSIVNGKYIYFAFMIFIASYRAVEIVIIKTFNISQILRTRYN